MRSILADFSAKLMVQSWIRWFKIVFTKRLLFMTTKVFVQTAKTILVGVQIKFRYEIDVVYVFSLDNLKNLFSLQPFQPMQSVLTWLTEIVIVWLSFIHSAWGTALSYAQDEGWIVIIVNARLEILNMI